MAHWDEHSSVAGLIGGFWGGLGLWGLPIGFLLHQIHDWLVEERPIHFWKFTYIEKFSLLVNIAISGFFLYYLILNNNIYLWIGIILGGFSIWVFMTLLV